MTDSQQLLAEYRQNGSDAAFRELVTRYVDLVYSTALRLVEGDTHRAEDVAQTVFVDLARKARTLPHEVRLGGWLHRDACLVAGHTMRGERRRQTRERQAVEMNTPEDHSEADFSQVTPLLDEAINELGEAERTAILLRFFEQQDFRAVGQALEISEDAARMRVTRALDKLHRLLTHRGVTLPVTALGTALATEAVTAAPAGLAGTVAGVALASAAASGGTAATLAKLMTITKLKTALIAAAIGAVLTPALLQHRALERLGKENARLANELVAKATGASTQATNSVPAAPNAAASTRQEIMRLKDQSGQLATKVAQLEQRRAENGKLRAQLAQPPAGLLAPEDSEAFAKAREKTVAIDCINNLKQLGLALRTWAQDNEGVTPPDILSMRNEVSTPKVLVCPADHAREIAEDWASYTSANCSYEYLVRSESKPDKDPTRVAFRCPIHGHVVLVDGRVQGFVAKRHPEQLVPRGGDLYFEPPTQPTQAAPVPQPGNAPPGVPPPGRPNQ